MLRSMIFMAIMVCLTGGCTGKVFSDESIFAPKPLRMGGIDKTKSPPEYVKGWDDGCKTGLSTMVNGYYKSFYGFKQDPYMIGDKTYFQAWNDAYTYCRQYSFRYTWDAYDRTYNKVLSNPLCLICPNELDRAQ